MLGEGGGEEGGRGREERRVKRRQRNKKNERVKERIVLLDWSGAEVVFVWLVGVGTCFIKKNGRVNGPIASDGAG